MLTEFKPFPKMARLSRECIITEKLDGTNASILIVPVPTQCDGQGVPVEGSLGVFDGHVIFAGSRNRWVQPGNNDNYGFAAWVRDNVTELCKLGPGQHFGEWWGAGIQRRYGLAEKRFSLFNASRWLPRVGGGVYEAVVTPGQPGDLVTHAEGPACCSVVPTLYFGDFNTHNIKEILEHLCRHGSVAAPGFMDPEGIVIYHTAAKFCFKKTIKDDASPKSLI